MKPRDVTTPNDLPGPALAWLRPPLWGGKIYAGALPGQHADHELRQFSIAIRSDIRLLRGKFGLDLVMLVQGHPPFEQQFWNWSVRESSANHIRLEKLMGKNVCKWPGHIIALELREWGSRHWYAVEGARAHRPGRGEHGKA